MLRVCAVVNQSDPPHAALRPASISVDPATMERTRSASVIGRLGFKFDDTGFPDEEWSDFVVIVLAEWLKSVSALVDRRSKTEELSFMEGPYAVELRRTDSSPLLTLKAVARTRRGSKIVVSDEVDGGQLLERLVDAGHVVADACREKNWNGTETSDLNAALANAEALRHD